MNIDSSAGNSDKFNELLKLIAIQNNILVNQAKDIAAMKVKQNEKSAMLEVLGRAILRDVMADVDRTIQRRQYSMMETLDLVAQGRSLARWGDGEVKLMLQPEFDLMFQNSNMDLAKDLQDLLRNYDSIEETTLLAFPTIYSSRLWQGIWAENWHLMKPILEASRARFANTHVSRPLFFQKHGQSGVVAWRKVWEGKRVCVIAGKGSKFELLPELFDNAESIIRIDSMPKNAYSDLSRLKNELDGIQGVDIFLTSLGPTGTVLAGWLASPEGGRRHAIDVGHLASSYLNVFKGGATPESVPLVRR
ncbi:GT-D fold domain-containing glycosyltransferase [Glutamicibacter sp. ZJUTW]|uniref:GT-D fold domain-containing glycosyltransferase n=1 Tax=Glutamicibacter sp. ZJUTW TaxID=1155384 RepID=UPI0011F380D5|nr:GT-D fold domain-containing glycosyltransferase [Glutamicibacter sp. ZJUTW]QEP07033.1 DUF1792 domain-containing protein [Glutamicibacter sp. ZJUTW]